MTAETSNARGEWVLVPRELLAEARNIAMEWTVRGRVPECGKFGQIAQDLDAMLAAAPPPAAAQQWQAVELAPRSAPVGVDAPGSRAWMAEVCRAAALSLAAHGVRNDQLSKVADWIAQQPAAVDGLAARLVDELDGLVGESYGVSGLHLNGDAAPWDELLPGGRFERLSSLDELRAALAAKQQGGAA